MYEGQIPLHSRSGRVYTGIPWYRPWMQTRYSICGSELRDKDVRQWEGKVLCLVDLAPMVGHFACRVHYVVTDMTDQIL